MKQSYRTLVLTCGLIMVTALAACTWQGLRSESEIQTRKLYVVGAMQQIDDDLVARRAQPFLNASFFDVDTVGITDAIAAIPWVDTVNVYRRWPDAVVIRLTERKPVARWAANRLLADDGELFTPQNVAGFSHLPQLNGPVGSGLRVLAQWRAMKPLLDRAGFDLTQLDLDPRGAWTATLRDGLVLRLGDENLSERLQRLVGNLSPQLRRQLHSAGYVDLRYSDGFAVGGDRPLVKRDENNDEQESVDEQKA